MVQNEVDVVGYDVGREDVGYSSLCHVLPKVVAAVMMVCREAGSEVRKQTVHSRI